jgi:hypothetical protein
MKSLAVFSAVLACLSPAPVGVRAQTMQPPHAELARPALPVIYSNARYDFCFRLPASWEGYSVLTRTWGGSAIDNSGKTISGLELVLRNPHWTEAHPWEDVPIMIFTTAQWEHAANDEYSFSAAPIGPTEIARNSRYVFALPARWDYDLARGWQEAQQLVQHGALEAPCPASRASPLHGDAVSK